MKHLLRSAFGTALHISSRRIALTAFALFTVAGSAHAVPVLFNSNPFAGSTANPDDGIRAVFAGNQVSLPGFDVKADQFVFDLSFFKAGSTLSFANSLAAGLAPSGLNMIVLQDTGSAFNAGSAANLIADAVNVDGAGFFVYSNTVLGVNRLVYSTNLNANTADLSILARIESPSGAAAVAALAGFGAANFVAAPVPEPSTWALASAGMVLVGAVVRRRRRAAAVA